MNIEPNSVLCWSGGLESTLLLAMLRQQPVEFDILTFRELWTKEQKRKVDGLIMEWDLRVFTYPPRQVFFATRETLVFDYGIGLFRDVLEGERCSAILSSIKTSPQPPVTWETYILGSRKDDTHALLDQAVPAERFEYNGMNFWCPFFDWSREQVIEKSIEMGLDVTPVTEDEDGGNLRLCTRCLDTTQKEVFCPEEKRMVPTMNYFTR